MVFLTILMSAMFPFSYDLHVKEIQGTNSRTVICMHGYGGNYSLIEGLVDFADSKFVGFNFPDHDIQDRGYEPKDLKFGTIDEILSALYVCKKYVIDQGEGSIDLYGRSAGGAALINMLGVLNSEGYQKELKNIGIGEAERKKIVQAIENGIIILDVPLKSVEEIIDLRGTNVELEALAANYRKSNFRPIDSVEKLKGLKLNVIVYLEEKDEITFNRDDEQFIEKLKKANSLGNTTVLKGSEGGHANYHSLPWTVYNKLLKK